MEKYSKYTPETLLTVVILGIFSAIWRAARRFFKNFLIFRRFPAFTYPARMIYLYLKPVAVFIQNCTVNAILFDSGCKYSQRNFTSNMAKRRDYFCSLPPSGGIDGTFCRIVLKILNSNFFCFCERTRERPTSKIIGEELKKFFDFQNFYS